MLSVSLNKNCLSLSTLFLTVIYEDNFNGSLKGIDLGMTAHQLKAMDVSALHVG